MSASPTGPRMLRLRVVQDAIVVPRPVLGDKTAGAGVLRRVGADLVRVAETGTRRRGREYVEPPATVGVEPTRRIDAAVYAGVLYGHYGHFLLESMGRLWYENLDHDTSVVWVAGTTDRFTPWMCEMLDRLGVGGERIIVDGASGSLEVGELLVPDQGFEVHRYLHPWMLSRLACTSARPPRRGSKLWLSRSRLGPLAGVDEEAQLEARLERKGWTVVHPEELTLAEQIELLAHARHIAGIEGSAFHTLLFVHGFRGTIDLLTRHDNPNFELIAEVAGWDQIRHPMPGGRSEEWHRPSGARDVHWSGIDVDAAARTIVWSSRRRWWRPLKAVGQRLRRQLGRARRHLRRLRR
jgi:hypothetical protein